MLWKKDVCDLMMVSAPSLEGKHYKYDVYNLCVQVYFPLQDLVGRSSILFENINLLKSSEMKLGTLMASTSCLATAMETNNNEEASEMVDFIAGLGVKEKHLLIDMPVVMNTKLVSNKSINFNVIMIQKINNSGKHVREIN